ncbi:CDC-like kinase [Monoraphidium neglectum]|uniref:CDC-like kinase n=1 Tax=Monoraphidium neglectum TaxID=145388 RepID=A0A0D2JAR8_9CHLO|nr:CDC-like kinase [Monoraphidium neglectum]KIY96827.1 CDC-like kinase [Monoraphidium neglectum]|eukprot:XP_013895847.1 CDC-like kinase [Monoraphidium neglectum]
MSTAVVAGASRKRAEEEENGSSTSPQPIKRQRLSSESEEQEGHYVYELGENISSRYKILSKFGEAAQKTALTHAPAPSLWRAPHASRHAYARGALAADAPRDPSRACRAPASLATPAPGTFGRVLECWDRRRKEYVAVKIVRNVDKYRHAAMIELEVLNTLEANDPVSKRKCVHLKEWFDYRGHVCMVFEKLGPSLYDFLRRNDYQPFPLAVVQEDLRPAK